ncbi:sensor histidine kinase [Xanthocytophaga agilis]|uniref:ATP-binding protein n=1 Tax=Xanthocytophaga agilis TaxID=3048010 RepID=A0AAE3R378_9BACT|nr:ATP-binding protein [Xanthocytophaga agilis]MDJ1499852.1 ATP-binding protein [Xanthocytophaga agilis]
MAQQTNVTDLLILIIGTLTTVLTVSGVIFFAFIFQRKLYRKQAEFREIEKLLKKAELQSAYALIEGRESERKRIAEDLHDNLGSLLATLKIYIDTLQNQEIKHEEKQLHASEKSDIYSISFYKDNRTTLIQKIHSLVEAAARETRKISHDLDSGLLQYGGFQAAIEQLVEAITNSQKLIIETVIDITDPLDDELSLNIYRIIQELFANTLKHAHATKARIEITQIPKEYISIIFEDNGKGFINRQVKKGIGLQHIYSRTERFQGHVTIDSSPEFGSTFIIEIPINQIFSI